MTNLKKNAILLVLISILFISSTQSATAGIGDEAIKGAETAIEKAYGYDYVIPRSSYFSLILIIIINYLLTFLAVLFLLGLIYAGYLWMTAKGNEEQITKAKKITREVLIGLIIVFLARIITELILTYIGIGIDAGAG